VRYSDLSSGTFVLQAGLNQPAAAVCDKAQLTCKDSLLVGWGGATDQDFESASVVLALGQGAAVSLEGCTLQYHPDSQHTPTVLAHQGLAVAGRPGDPLPGSLVVADWHVRVDLTQCQLVGPAFRGAAFTGVGVRAGRHVTITLVGVC
jgi:hypothetical protein